MRRLDVLISGAGVAGMALAEYLSRAGHRVTVVERAAAVRASGYAVDFRGAALDVLADLGILDETRALDTQMLGTSLIDAAGAVLEEIAADRFSGDLEVPKHPFSQLLYRHTRASAEYVFDDSVSRLDDRGEHVVVEFRKAPARRFDLVVGADGVYSTVRRLAFADIADPIRHLGMSGAGFSTDNFLGLDHRGLLHATPHSVIYLFNAQDPDRLTVSLSFASESPALDRMDRQAQQSAIHTAFADHGWQAPRLLAAMDAAADFYFSSACQVHLDQWSRGRVVLVGDAAYCAAPTAGMGTSQALLGAQRLAQCLTEFPDDHPAAFTAFEESMRPYVTQNQRLGAAAAADFGAARPDDG